MKHFLAPRVKAQGFSKANTKRLYIYSLKAVDIARKWIKGMSPTGTGRHLAEATPFLAFTPGHGRGI
jgi:hypothetical protein